jgi:hypothetical protein
MGVNVEVERAVRELFSAQHGVATTAQLRSAGLSRKAERHRLETGRFVTRHRGVFADASFPETWRQRVMAAVLAGGPTAFASHVTAAQLLGMEPIDEDTPIEITTVLERAPTIPGVRSHRSGLLDDRDMALVDGIPTATAARVINDLSVRKGPTGLGRLADDAVRRGLTSPGAIVQCLEKLPWAPGRSPNAVREMLAARLPEFGLRESLLEEFVFDSLRHYDVPLPLTQVWVQLASGPRRLDKCYVDELLVLESDGFEFHSGRGAFDDDRRRNNELVLAGYRVLHFTTEFTDHEIACTVARALGHPAPEPAREGPQPFKRWCGGRRVALDSARGSGAGSAR